MYHLGFCAYNCDVPWFERQSLNQLADGDMLHLLNKISLAIGHTTRAMTLLGFYLVTGSIAIATLFALVAAPFEYSIGPDDLAMADVVSLTLIVLVVWRFFQRGRQSGRSWWPLMQRIAFALTYATLLCLGVLAVLFRAHHIDPELANSNVNPSGGYDDLLTYGLTGFFIAVVYGATPLPSLFSKGNRPRALLNEAEPRRPDSEPDHSSEPPILKPSTETEKDSK